MKGSLRWVAASAGWALVAMTAATGVACGGSSEVSSCAGDYAGSYSGSASGTITGTLDDDGTFSVVFTQDGGSSVGGTGEVGDDGAVEVSLGPNQVIGRLDFDACTATGTWTFGDLGSGDWEASRD